MTTPTLAHAIRCLEDELARQLDKAGAIALELRTLRELVARGLRPTDQVPVGAVPAEPEPTEAASSEVGSGSPGLVRPATPDTPADPVRLPKIPKSSSSARSSARPASSTTSPPADDAPPAGIARPDTYDCIDCDRSFPTKQGLSLHRTRTHPIEKRPFDPDAARARAAAAMDGDGGISKLALGGRPKAVA